MGRIAASHLGNNKNQYKSTRVDITNRRDEMSEINYMQDLIDYVHDCILCDDPITSYDVQVTITSCEYDPYSYMKAYRVEYAITLPNGEIFKDDTHVLDPIALGAYKPKQ